MGEDGRRAPWISFRANAPRSLRKLWDHRLHHQHPGQLYKYLSGRRSAAQHLHLLLHLCKRHPQSHQVLEHCLSKRRRQYISYRRRESTRDGITGPSRSRRAYGKWVASGTRQNARQKLHYLLRGFYLRTGRWLGVGSNGASENPAQSGRVHGNLPFLHHLESDLGVMLFTSAYEPQPLGSVLPTFLK